MIRDFFRKHRLVKYAGLTLGLAVICTGVFFALHVGGVKAENEDYKMSYVPGETATPKTSQITVTSEGSNLQYKVGSGKAPSSDKVPTATGLKGSETNPFVILEIVADKSYQQLSYLGQDEGSNEPLDVMQIGIDMSKKSNNRSYVPGSNDGMEGHLHEIDGWISKWNYSVFKLDSKTETEKVNYSKIKKLYSVTLTEDKLKNLKIDKEQFVKDYENSKERIWNRDGIDVQKLMNKNKPYAQLFVKDDDGKKIRDIAIADKYNWKPECETKIVQEEKNEIFHEKGKSGKGFLVAVEPGEGDFGFANEEDARNWRFTKSDIKAENRWIYVSDEEQINEEYRNRQSNEFALKYNYFKVCDNQIQDNKIYYSGIEKLGSDYKTSKDITGLILDLSTTDYYSAKYVMEPEKTKTYYTFSYWGLSVTTNILKRSLFNFTSDSPDSIKNHTGKTAEEKYNDFHLKVITMTPDEINKAAKKDTDDTLDIIERADLFYIGGYDDNTEIKCIRNLYKNYIDPSSNPDDPVKSFKQNDLEWSSCYKIVYRLCGNKNLPLIMTQTTGLLLCDELMKDQGGNKTKTSVNMYISSKWPSAARTSGSCNIAKLYLICAQFDLTAKKSDDKSYIRTFNDDLLNQLQVIDVNDDAVSTTGYYNRTILASNSDGTIEAGAEKCRYWWNPLTFFPQELGDIFTDSKQQFNNSDENQKRCVLYGYNSWYFKMNDNASSVFDRIENLTKVKGSDGETGNVTFIYKTGDTGAGGSQKWSTVIGDDKNGGDTTANNVLNIAYKIMNNLMENVSSMEVKVLNQKKEYVKMDDTAVLLDYVQNKKLSYGGKQSYLKIQISRGDNDLPGLVTKVRLKNSSGDAETLTLYKSKDFTSSNECDRETYKDDNGTATGYNVYEPLIAYVPYSLQKWAEGYDTVEVTTVGRIHSVKKDKDIQGDGEKTDISISERTLFDLE